MTQSGIGIQTAPAERVKSRSAGDYVSLLKLRPMSVVVYSAVVGLICAPGSMPLVAAFVAIACIAAGGGGAAALNMWYEADRDALMKRTARRALPSGKLGLSDALVFGVLLTAGSVLFMGLAVGWFASAVLAATITAYSGLYTIVLKHRTRHSVLIGGSLAGVLTPLSGWAAATGSLGIDAFALFAFVLVWTMPHVWSQAIYRREDYAAAGIPMMPVVLGSRATRKRILLFTIAHVAVSLIPVAMGLAGVLFGALAIASGFWLISKSKALASLREGQEADFAARKYFRQSIAYVVILLTALAVEHGLGLLVPLGGFIK